MNADTPFCLSAIESMSLIRKYMRQQTDGHVRPWYLRDDQPLYSVTPEVTCVSCQHFPRCHRTHQCLHSNYCIMHVLIPPPCVCRYINSLRERVCCGLWYAELVSICDSAQYRKPNHTNYECLSQCKALANICNGSKNHYNENECA